MGVEAPPAARGQKLFAKQKGVAYFVTDRYLGERSLLTADGQSAFRLPYDGRQREREFTPTPTHLISRLR